MVLKEMKDSGIEWIGEIPKTWSLEKIKYLLVERIEKNNPIKTREILSLTAKQGVIPYKEKEGGGNKPKEDLTAYKLAYPGDIVMNSMNILSGAVGLSHYFGCVSPVYYMLIPKEGIAKFFNYIFQTIEFQKSLLGLGNGILIKESKNGNFNTIRMRIPMEKIKKLSLAITNIEDQNKIADFLDKKCSELGKLKSDIEKQIAILADYKKSLITETVTKGLNPDVEMKDSGIEWIGDIPKRWQVKRLKYVFDFCKGLSITKENLKESGIPVISYGQIHSKDNKIAHINKNLIRYIDEKYLECEDCLVNKNNFIFADTSEDIDGCGNNVYVDKDIKLFAGYHTIILKNKDMEDTKYIAYLFYTDCWRSQIRKRVSGIKVFSITRKILKEVTIILPSIQEQKEIVDFLDKKCSKIDEIIEGKQKQVAKIEEYKKSLIYEYVTGKKDVY